METSGGRGIDKFLPHLLGHEGIAKVISTHETVGKVRPGETVVVGWRRGLGADAAGPEVTWRDIPINAGPVTTFSSVTVVSENRVFSKPSSLRDEHASLLGCAASTGFGMVQSCEIDIRDKAVAIVGLGGIGLFALLTALAMEPARVLIVEPNRRKHGSLSNLGENRSSEMTWSTEIDGYEDRWDVVFEASGSVHGVQSAIDLARPHGGQVVVASHPRSGDRVLLDPFDLVRGKILGGSWGGGLLPEKHKNEIASLILEFEPAIDAALTSKSFDLEDINSAFSALASGDIMRPSVSFSSDLR